MYKNGFPGLQESYYIHDQLTKKFLPELHKHLQSECIIAELYSTHWFMTQFAVYFPRHVVVRIWDCYLVEGRKTIFRVALAILKLNKIKLLSCDISTM